MAFGKKGKNKVEFEKSEMAERLGIRVSTPNGYYPEDVDRVLLNYEDNVKQLQLENSRLKKEKEKAEKDYELLYAQFVDYQLQVSSLQLKENTFEEDLQNMGKFSNITGEPVENFTVETSTKDNDVDIVTLTDINSNKNTTAILDETGELDILDI